MKNKKLVYVLLPVTIAVWGVAFMRIYRYFNPEGQHEQQVVYALPTEVQVADIPETFVADAGGRDPFLGTLIKKHPVSTATVAAVKKKEAIKETPKAATEVQVSYSGMIRNQKSGTQLAMIQINGEEKFMKQGETAGGMKLGRIFRDSVEIIIGKQKKIIRK